MRIIACQKLLLFLALFFSMLANAFHISRVNRRWSRTYAVSKESLKGIERVLVIVESPAKARTIQKFLKDMKDEHREYVVDSCQGHIRDLAKELPTGVKQKAVCPGLRVRLSDLGVDVFDNFKPYYVTLPGKEDIVKRLKDESKTADKIFLATDEDREGEAISWHLIDVLKPKVPYQRAVFHEITKKAIEKSFAEPRELDMDLVHAQETRRIVDKLAGFTLSPLLWKFISLGLSAGRVQTYGLSMIANKEKDRWGFVPSKYYSLEAAFCPSSLVTSVAADQNTFSARLYQWHGQKIASESDFDGTSGEVRTTGRAHTNQEILVLNQELAKDVMISLNASDTKFTIHQKSERKITRSAPLPLITSSLQQIASKRLGFSPSRTMILAQTLYENGYITYMRTDSPVLSTQAQEIAKEMVTTILGASYLATEKTSSTTMPKNAQEAHEAIRPAEHKGKFRIPEELKTTSLSVEEVKLYDLIFKTTLASMMKPALSKTITLTIAASEQGNEETTTTSVSTGKNTKAATKKATKEKLQENLLRCSETIMTFDGYTAIFHPNKRSALSSEEVPSQYFDSFQIGDALQLSTFDVLKRRSSIMSGSSVEEGVDEEKSVVPHEEEVLREDPNAVEDEGRSLGIATAQYPGILPIPHTTRASSRYTEASFIKELEMKGVGRPSTYSHIFQVLKDRGYAIVEKQSIIPTIKGMIVAQFMFTHFAEFCDELYTANMEKQLDRIAKGELDKLLFLQAFYFGEDPNKHEVASGGNAGEAKDITHAYQGLLTKINDKLSRVQQSVGGYEEENWDSSLTSPNSPNSGQSSLTNSPMLNVNTSRCITLPYISIPGQFVLQRNGLCFQYLGNTSTSTSSTTTKLTAESAGGLVDMPTPPVGSLWKLPDIMSEDIRNITDDSLLTVMRNHVPMSEEAMGQDPKTGMSIYVRHGRYGRYLQLGDDKEEGMKRRSFPMSMTTTPASSTVSDSVQDMLAILDLPTLMGTSTSTGHTVYLTIGSNGLYLTNTIVPPGTTSSSSSSGNSNTTAGSAAAGAGQIIRISVPSTYTIHTLTPTTAVELFDAAGGGGHTSTTTPGDSTTTGTGTGDLPGDPFGVDGKVLGTWQGETVTIRTGRFGYFVKGGRIICGLGKFPADTITIEQAIGLLGRKAAMTGVSPKTSSTGSGSGSSSTGAKKYSSSSTASSSSTSGASSSKSSTSSSKSSTSGSSSSASSSSGGRSKKSSSEEDSEEEETTTPTVEAAVKKVKVSKATSTTTTKKVKKAVVEDDQEEGEGGEDKKTEKKTPAKKVGKKEKVVPVIMRRAVKPITPSLPAAA